MRPKISVIVPIYNAELYLEQCIESVLNQTLRDIELLLIDDGSTDNSFLICEKYKKFLVNMNKSQNFLSWRADDIISATTKLKTKAEAYKL